ncbi:hypothetical protein QJQ45_009837 [Haematococcus lacustris]|nr:hypothetical protein QJQ45_009837 [Haematococcus lacustris]
MHWRGHPGKDPALGLDQALLSAKRLADCWLRSSARLGAQPAAAHTGQVAGQCSCAAAAAATAGVSAITVKEHGDGGLANAVVGEPGPSTPPPAQRSKRTKAEKAAKPTQPTKGKAQGKAAKAKPAPQPGRWLDRDCNAALNMQRIGESRWRPLELCYWPEQGALPAKGKEYPGLGYKRVRDKPTKTQPAEAQ